MHIALDPGSTHMGKKEYCKELIRVANDIGANSIKFQLFHGEEYMKAGNIKLSLSLFKEMYSYGKSKGMEVTASTFNREASELLASLKLPYIKFAYSQQHRLSNIEGLLTVGRTVAVSTDVIKAYDLLHLKQRFPDRLIRLFRIPGPSEAVYPTMTLTNFEGLFPERFEGLSDHSLGIEEPCRAAKAGAVWIEKHFRLPYSDCSTCPDGKFALEPKDAERMIKSLRGIHVR